LGFWHPKFTPKEAWVLNRILQELEGNYKVKFFFEPYALLWKHRRLLIQTTWSDIRTRFAGSILGLIWLVLFPLLFLGAYAFMYIFVFKVRFAEFNSIDYIVLIFCGLIPFLGFSEALGSGVSSVTSNSALVKNTLFPIDLVPVKTVLVSQATQVVGTGLLLIVLTFMGKITIWVLLLPIIWVLQILFSIGLIWVLSSLNVFLRDIQNTISVVILMLMMVSPIAYTADMVPSNLRTILLFNPLYYLIISYQSSLMLGMFPDGWIFWILAALAFGVFWGGYMFFIRMKLVFVDSI
jgi:lipopolysaccharide transport system permease protein